MAVAIPIVMAVSGASAAVGAAIGVSAALVTAGATVLATATGVSGAINKAATKVFGKDLVKAANVVGSIYMATSGFSADGGATDASSANAVNGLDAASDAAAAASGGAQSGYATIDASGGVTQLAGADAAAAATKFATQSANAASTGQGLVDTALTTTKKYLGDPKVVGSVLQAGGEMLAKKQELDAQEEAAAKLRQQQLEDQEKFKTGSGLNTYYTRRKVFQSAGG